MLDAPDVERAIVFTRTKHGANRLTEKLQRRGIRSSAIHGNKSQTARQKALTEFREAHIKVLVATDVAARGIDIEGVTHVVNFDIPSQPEDYVHRIGRTGRAGASGIAISLCTPDESGDLRAIEQLIGKKVTVNQQPTVQTGVQTGVEGRRVGSRGKAAKRSTTTRAGRPSRPTGPKKRRRRKSASAAL